MLKKVYISSTYTDLKDQRHAVQQVLSEMGFDVITFDDFGAIEDSPMNASKNAIKDSDIVLLLIAHSYGYIPPNTNKSIIELEYETAREYDKPILTFIIDEKIPWHINFISKGNERFLLESFKERIKANHIVASFESTDDLAAKVAVAVQKWSTTKYIPPEVEKGKKATIDNILYEVKTLKSQVDLLTEIVLQSKSLQGNIQTEIMNFNVQPAEFLGPIEQSINYSKCFIIMPYSESWSEAVEKIIQEICEKVELKFEIAKNMKGRFIPQDIFQGITSSGIIVADLSGANPNVTYEIGLADVLGRNVILLSQNEKIPFDFQGQRLILYENTVAGGIKLREILSETLTKYKEHYIKNGND